MSMEFPFESFNDAVENIRQICHRAWTEDLMKGWSGNASARLADDLLVVTAASTAKGFLSPEDCLLINFAGEVLSGKGKASSESGAHIRIYQKLAGCRAILHTHPPYMQALERKYGGNNRLKRHNMRWHLLNTRLFEADLWCPRLYVSPALPPGSCELAEATAASLDVDATLPCAIWLENHGLFAIGPGIADCLCLTEEFEHLARIRLMSSCI